MGKEITTIEYITPDTANLYLRKNIDNRPLNDRIVKFYLSIMQRGEWKLTNDAITFSTDGHLLNGQHRLKALSQYDKALPFIVARGFNDEVFQCLDSGVGRSASDVLAISGVQNNKGLSAGIKKLLILERKNTITDGSIGKAVGTSNAMVLFEYNKNPDRFQRLFRKCAIYNNRLTILNKSEMVAYCEYLIRIGWEEDFVCSFFDELCSLITPSNNTILLLRQRLITSKIGRATTIPTSQKQELLIKTWNYYVDGKEVKTLKITDEEHENIWFKSPNK